MRGVRCRDGSRLSTHLNHLEIVGVHGYGMGQEDARIARRFPALRQRFQQAALAITLSRLRTRIGAVRNALR